MSHPKLIQWARDAYYRLLIDEKLPPKKCYLYVIQDYNTANWSPDPRNRIVLGEGILNHLPLHATLEDERTFFTAFVYHELAHSIWTDTDFKRLNELLQEHLIPFAVFNLFEDARIEQKMREHIGIAFNWLNYLEIEAIQDPLTLFFAIVQSEHRHEDLKALLKITSKAMRQEFKTVLGFYYEAIRAQRTLALIPILERWFKRYPNTRTIVPVLQRALFATEDYPKEQQKEEISALIEGSEELVEHLETLAKNGEYRYDPIENPLTLSDIKTLETRKGELLISELYEGGPSKKSNNNHEGKLNYISDEDIQSGLYTKIDMSKFFDPNEAQILVQSLIRLFKTKSRTVKSQVPSKKINLRHLTLDKEMIYKKKSAYKNGLQSIALIVDLSGSMEEPMRQMRQLIYALNELVKLKKIKVTMLLSAVAGDVALNQPLVMPIPEYVFSHIHAKYDAEGIVETMIDNLRLLQRSDYVWILTDGMFDLNNMNKKFFKTQKIHTHGIYLGHGEHQEIMQEHFDTVICEKNIPDLASRLALMILEGYKQ